MRFLIFAACLLCALQLHAAEEMGVDAPGSEDLALLPRPTHAQIVNYRRGPGIERIYPQGAIRTINNRMRMEQSLQVEGELIALTYRLPDRHPAMEAFNQARVALLDAGSEPLFWCEGRACGRNSLWANVIFENAQLTGSDDLQAYLLMRLAEPEDDRLLVLYAITRGNRRAYLHIEQMRPTEPLGELLPTPATLMRELRSSGELNLKQAPAEPDAAWADLLTQTLKLDTTLPVALSGPGAALWLQALIERGIRQRNLALGEKESAALQIRVQR
jgi:hypothetical protein